MKLRILLTTVLTLALLSTAAIAQTSGDENEGSQLTQDASTGAYTFSWWGQAGRTYFLQQSDDLLNWTYLPVIESGADQVIQWGFTSSQAQFFLRLKYTDDYTSDPFNDDFDGDGVSNWDELTHGTDPFSAALDTNGLPLDWETFFGLSAGLDANAPAPRGDGLTYLQAFRLGLNPNDFYNGHPPVLALVSGDGQTGPAGGIVPLPLIVSVCDADGVPFVNAPVTFTVDQNGDLVQKSSNNAPAATLTVHTDSNGQAQVLFQFASTDTAPSHITATIANIAQPTSVVFTENPGTGGSGSPGASTAPANFFSQGDSDGNLDMTWTNNDGDQNPVEIEIQQADGSWKLLATLPPGTTSYHYQADQQP